MGSPMRTVAPGQCKTVYPGVYMTALIDRCVHNIHGINNTITIDIIQSTGLGT